MAPKNAGLRGAIKRALSRYVRLRNGMFRQPRVLHEQTKASAHDKNRSFSQFRSVRRRRANPFVTSHDGSLADGVQLVNFTRRLFHSQTLARFTLCVCAPDKEGERGEGGTQTTKQ